MFGLLLLAIAIIQLPAVQTYAVSKISNYIEKATNHDVSIEYVNISWFDQAYLEQIQVNDFLDSTMISAEKITFDFDLLEIIKSGELSLDRIEVNKGYFHVIKHSNEYPLNLNRFLAELRALRKSNSPKEKQASLHVSEIDVWNSTFQLDDFRRASLNDRLDYNHLSLLDINTTVHDFEVVGDTINMLVSSLITRDSEGRLEVKKMHTKLQVNPNQMVFDELEVQTAKSLIKDYVRFDFSNISNLSYFIDSVKFDLDLTNSYFHTSELAHFAPSLARYPERIDISGHYFGGVRNLQAEYVLLKTGDNTFIKGNCFISGLPNISETFMEIKVGNSKVEFADLNFFLPIDTLFGLKDLGVVKLDGTFLGFSTDFVAAAKFGTRAGTIKTDINLKLAENPKNSSYSGKLTMSDVDLGTVLDAEKVIGKISMDGEIEGKGITVETAEFKLDASISNFEVNDYNYTNIYTKGDFRSEFFNGLLTVDDPNLQLNLNGVIDLRKGNERIIAAASLDTAYLMPLKLARKDFFVSSEVDVALYGLKLDDITGQLGLVNTAVSYQGKSLTIDSLNVSSILQDSNRQVHVVSEGLFMEIDGNFRTTEMLSDVAKLYKEYKLHITNDKESLDNYYSTYKPNPRNYQVDFKLSVTDANNYLDPFFDNLFVSKNLEVSGGFLHDRNSSLTLVTTFDSLVVDKHSFKNTILECNTSKMSNEQGILALFYLSSEKQYWNNAEDTKNFEAEAIWSNQTMDLSVFLEHQDLENHASLESKVEFLEDTTLISIEESDILFNDKEWTFSENNEIMLSDDQIGISNFSFSAGVEELLVEGVLSDSSNLEIGIEQLELDNFELVLNRPIHGITNGRMNLSGPMRDLLIAGEFRVDTLRYNDLYVGDVIASTEWDDISKKLDVFFDVKRDETDIVKLEGDIDFSDANRRLDIDATLDGAEIEILKPFVEEYVSEFKGSVAGSVHIGGSVQDPELFGDLMIENGATHIDYLNTFYGFSGNVGFSEHLISFNKFEVKDRSDNKAYFSGGITHKRFSDMQFDISGDLFNFNVLNTFVNDNSLYYGDAFATGNVNFLGSLQNIKIVAKAKTNKNSKLFVPLSYNSSADLKDYISFVDFSDTTQANLEIDTISTVNLRGVELDLELEVTPEAYFELIFDLKAGDIIRGRGNGNLKFQINTEGDFKMSGDYIIEEGGYNFTLYNIINKEFVIQNGSKISWYGDPYKAILDIKAAYEQNVSFAPIIPVSQENENSPGLRRRFPSVVQLDLTGEMMAPELGFTVDFKDYNQTITLSDKTTINLPDFVDPFKYKLANDEQELKRQVFSLLILRKLSSENSFSAPNNTFGTSVSELISNQLSYWINQVDENLEIDVDLASLDQDAFNTFQLRLSYTFLNGRLRVSREGGFASYDANSSQLSSIIGDISLEYLLTSDGRLRARMYSKNAQTLENSQGFETGVSLQYVRSFDYLQDIWRKNRSRKTKFVDAEGNVVEIVDPKKKDKKKTRSR